MAMFASSIELLDIPTNQNIKNVSYLRARDPSILACNVALSGVEINFNEATSNTTTDLLQDTQKDDGHLQIYLRIKKANNFKELYEVSEDNILLCKVPEGAQCIRNFRDGTTMTKSFKFSKIFGPESSQTDVFNNVVKVKLLQFINGYNCSLLTYGASGSGKTFTLTGTADEPGIVPRALEYLFRTLPPLLDEPRTKPLSSGGIVRLSESGSKMEKVLLRNLLTKSNVNIDLQHTQTYMAMQKRLSEEPVAFIADDISDVNLGIWVSFAEIYNEFIYDLLTPEPPRGQTRQKLRLAQSNGTTYIKGLTYIYVSSGLEAYYVLQYGLHNLKYAATSVNDHSSRSHSIFTIKLAQASDTKEGISVSSFNFCDLAGSERVKKTHNVGQRLKESNNINKSLLILGRCISLVREAQKSNTNKLIPFRESKLTQLFQKALQGQEAISMIVNINPTREMFDESQHVLNFSAIAKDVTVKQQQLIKRPRKNRFTEYMEDRNTNCSTITEETDEMDIDIEELQMQIVLLQEELQQQKLNFEEEKEHTINVYKKLLDDANREWGKRCQRWEQLLSENMRESNIHPENTVETGRKRQRSIIVIQDSSDEEDVPETKKCTYCKKEVCGPDCELVIIQTEIAQTKLRLQAKEDEIQHLQMKNKMLTETLESARTSYLSLPEQYVIESEKLKSRIVTSEDKINELNKYIEASNQV